MYGYNCVVEKPECVSFELMGPSPGLSLKTIFGLRHGRAVRASNQTQRELMVDEAREISHHIHYHMRPRGNADLNRDLIFVPSHGGA